MDLKDLKIKLTHSKTYECEDYENLNYEVEEELIEVCKICLLEDEDVLPIYDNVATIDIHNKIDNVPDKKLNICILSNYEDRKIFFEDLEDNFCLDMDIYDGEEKIGNVSFNRLFVEGAQDIGIWLDNEAPNSMKIGTHICKKDFEIVEGRYVGIIDELIIDREYFKEGFADCVIYMIYSLILAWGFKIYYLYTQPKSSIHGEYLEDIIASSNLNAYASLGFEIVDKANYIMKKDVWHELQGRMDFDEGMEDVYLP